MHLVHPRDLPEERWEGFPFQTLLHPEIGGRMGVYRLTITESNPHVHDELDQIYIVIRGRGQVMIEDEVRDIEPGCLVHIPRGSCHALTPSDADPVTVYSIEYGAV